MTTPAGTPRELPPRLPRASYAPLSLYSPPRPAVAHDLSDNTNQFGAPPAALAELSRAGADLLVAYPSQPSTRLLGAIAGYTGVEDTACIVTGCGSDDLLDCIMRALAEPGDRVALSWPSFTMIPYFARTNGLEPVLVPYTADWDADADRLLDARARITYLCAPNNPTGTGLRPETVRRVLDEADGIVVMDEAYAEFALAGGGRSWALEAANHGRLVVTRTLSKAFGLAGLRVGYAIGAPALLHEVEKARGPYKVTAVSDRVAAAALEGDVDWMRANAAAAVESRELLRTSLLALGLAPLPSEANFLFVPVADAPRIAERVAEGGILLRAFRDLPGVGDALRITAAPRPVMEQTVLLLGEALR